MVHDNVKFPEGQDLYKNYRLPTDDPIHGNDCGVSEVPEIKQARSTRALCSGSVLPSPSSPCSSTLAHRCVCRVMCVYVQNKMSEFVKKDGGAL